MDQALNPPPFALCDCALITLVDGAKAQNLKEFLAGLEKAAPSSIYHHFWGRLLRPAFDEPEYNNDFASWVYRALHDKPLAERLSVLVPSDFVDLEALRQELIEVVEERLDETEYLPWAQADQQFHFVRANVVVFDTALRFTSPEEMRIHLPDLSTGSIYYHFIDARARTAEHCNDFSSWLTDFGPAYQPLATALHDLDPFFSSLKETRKQLVEIFDYYCAGEES